MAFEKPYFSYLQGSLVWGNFSNIIFATRFSLKIAVFAGNENPSHLHEDVGCCFSCSESDADGLLAGSKHVHGKLE